MDPYFIVNRLNISEIMSTCLCCISCNVVVSDGINNDIRSSSIREKEDEIVGDELNEFFSGTFYYICNIFKYSLYP